MAKLESPKIVAIKLEKVLDGAEKSYDRSCSIVDLGNQIVQLNQVTRLKDGDHHWGIKMDFSKLTEEEKLFDIANRQIILLRSRELKKHTSKEIAEMGDKVWEVTSYVPEKGSKKTNVEKAQTSWDKMSHMERVAFCMTNMRMTREEAEKFAGANAPKTG